MVTHANARRAEVRLFRAGDFAELSIADDGRGFDIVEAGRSAHGLGLVSISERVRLVGGTVSIVTELNKGTRLRVQVPANGHVRPGPCKLTHMPTPRRTTVLIADDHAIVMEGLVTLLKEHDFDVVGAVGDGQKLIEAARRLKPDVIVTDLSMPELSGLDVLGKLKDERIDSKVVVLTMHNDGERATQALKAGASAFLLKESAGEELVTAIHQALQGRVYLTPAVTRAVMERMADAGGQVRARADAAAARRAAPDRQGTAHEGNRRRLAAVDADRRNPQVRNDAGARRAFDRGTGEVRHRATAHRGLSPPGAAS